MNSSKKKYTLNKQNKILDYKDIDELKKYTNEQGKILSRRSTGLNSKQQKEITKYIKRARILALLPFLNKQ
uniref:Ribosomal protein S18 n=1 Tax=Dictyurus purpurascens TaxID=189649 RepID=A0A4D6WVR0_9FLOR|nr:ribosomal protein S18 [Dictyurus purpurascens]